MTGCRGVPLELSRFGMDLREILKASSLAFAKAFSSSNDSQMKIIGNSIFFLYLVVVSYYILNIIFVTVPPKDWIRQKKLPAPSEWQGRRNGHCGRAESECWGDTNCLHRGHSGHSGHMVGTLHPIFRGYLSHDSWLADNGHILVGEISCNYLSNICLF